METKKSGGGVAAGMLLGIGGVVFVVGAIITAACAWMMPDSDSLVGLVMLGLVGGAVVGFAGLVLLLIGAILVRNARAR